MLQKIYNQSREQIALIISELLWIGELDVSEPDVVWLTLDDYKKPNADFSDHLLARVNQARGCETTVTFGKKASKQPAFSH